MMKYKYVFLFLFFLLSFYPESKAQSDFYNVDSIPEIRIYFAQTNWDAILDSFYIAGQKERLLASINIGGETLDSVGIRYKGFSSVSTVRQKNPFNIKLDFIKKQQRYAGIDKIKLSNVIQDPSFLREVLSYEIGRKYLPSSEANFAKVFINDVYWGLYTNVEAVNKDFISRHYGSNDNAFFKCNPAVLDFDGENSNLGDSPGTDSTDYYPFYDIESDYGWAELYELIRVLNQEPEDIEQVLNVDRTLWMHAFNYALINFDSYVGYAQNFYLYKDDQGRFNPILWDLNQSFASYRLTDASEHFDGFSIAEAKTMDPLLHYTSISVIPRPLMRQLFSVSTYRKRYLAHLRTIIEENFANQNYEQRGQYLQDLIESAVLADTNKFYSNDDFYNNLSSTVSDLVDYPGIIDLMDARTTYLQSYPGYQSAPEISNVAYSPQTIVAGEEVWVTAEASNADSLILAYRFGGNGLFKSIRMRDDGTQNDGAAGDGIYGIQLGNIGNSIQYFLYGENDTAGRFSPERAAYEYYLIQTAIAPGDLVINELMAANGNTAKDEAGEYDDWIELYNTTEFDLSTAGLYLSDDTSNLKKWPLPDIAIAPGGYLIVWADSDEEQGGLHANFKLSSAGETLLLSDENALVVDSITFGEQSEDVSIGRIPNGSGPFVLMPPTFASKNSLTVSVEEVPLIEFSLAPNPAQTFFTLTFADEIPTQILMYSTDGKLIKKQIPGRAETTTKIGLDDFVDGIYFVHLVFEDLVLNEKIVVRNLD